MKKSNAFITSETRTRGVILYCRLQAAIIKRHNTEQIYSPLKNERNLQQSIYTSKFARRGYPISTRSYKNILYVYVSSLNLHLFANKIWVQIYNLS